MNRALWTKGLIEARLLLGSLILLMFVFNWIFVWITSKVELKALHTFLRALPPEMTGLIGVSIDEVATVAGRIALAYIDPVVLVVAAIWGIARGSDVVAGEINRGTMEMLLAQPLRRAQILIVPSIITLCGAVLLSCVAWLGTTAGILTVSLGENLSPVPYLIAATNLFALILFVAGVCTFLSSWDSYRWRTIGIMGGFYIISLVMEVMSKSVPALKWLRYLSFLGAYEPQVLVTTWQRAPAEAWAAAGQYNAILAGIGLAGFVAALAVFTRRDVPAPL
ncbi:MAG: ABC transporter permease [Pirellulales bacterium]|nr:ABC transporter permease [Pirellulales bacterium]